MAQVLNYKDFSDSCVKVAVPAGKKIKECFDGINWDNKKIFVNGTEATSDYKIKENDVVVIRSIPHLTGLAIGLAVIAIGVGIAAGIYSYRMNKEAQKAQKELEKLKKQTSDGITNVPYLKGASNTVATGKTQPYVIGTHLFTPYVLNGGGNSYKGYSTISGAYGKRQFYNVVLEGGFNYQILRKMYADDVTLKTFADNEPQQGVFNFAPDSPFASQDSLIEVSQDGSLFTTEIFNKKIVEQQVSDQLKKHPASSDDDGGDDDDYEDLYYTLDENAMAADVCILFNGLKQYTSSGSLAERTVEVVPQWSANYAVDKDNAVWNTFKFDQVESVDPVYKTYARTVYYEIEQTIPVAGMGRTFYMKMMESNLLEAKKLPEQTSAMSTYTVSGDAIPTENVDTSDWTVAVSQKKNISTYKFLMAVTVTHTVTCLENAGEEKVTSSNTFTYKLSRQLRFNAHADFPFSSIFESTTDDDGNTTWQKKYACPITIRLTSSTRKLASGNDVSDCYVQWVQSTVADVTRSIAQGAWVDEKIIGSREAALSTIIGLRIESTTSNEDKLGKISVETSALAPIYDTDNNEWKMSDNEFIKSSTSNPASWLLEVLTSYAHTPSQVDISEIDLESFADLYKYCEDNAYEYNRVIADGVAKSDLLESILSVCNAVMYQNIYGQISVAIDTTRENATYILNEQNLVSFKYEKSFARSTDGLRVKYVDASNGYVENSFVQLYDTSIDPDERPLDCTLREVSLTGITDIKQARRSAIRTMRSEKLRNKTATAQIGAEGAYFVPLDKALVQHSSLKHGLGSTEVKSVITETDESGVTYITGLTLADTITLEADTQYVVLVQCVSDSYCTQKSYTISGADGATDTVYFTEESKINLAEVTIYPHTGDILSYGTEIETLTSAMTVTAIEPADNMGYNLTLVDYDERIFAEPDLPDYPEYDGHFTTSSAVPSTVPDSVPDASVTYDVLATTVDNSVSEATANVKQEIVDEIEVESFTAYVYSDVTSAGVAVNDLNITPQEQTVEVVCHVIIADEEQEFNFGTPTLPDGWSYTTDYHTMKITVPAGAEITSGQLQIPVQYREVISVGELIDENGVAYTDGEGKAYKTYELGTTLVTYNMPFGYTGVKGGRYMGAMSKWEIHRVDVGSDEVVFVYYGDDNGNWYYPYSDWLPGDYFTWVGDTVEDTSGYWWQKNFGDSTLTKSHVYIFNGIYAFKNTTIYTDDTTASHNMTAMSDVLSVLEEESSSNNSVVDEYVNKLVANDAFIGRLAVNTAFVDKLVCTDAFIEKLAAKIITLQSNGIIKSSNYSGTAENGTISEYGDEGFAMAADGKADFVSLHATDMVADGGTFNNITISENSTFNGLMYVKRGILFQQGGTDLSISTLCGYASSYREIYKYRIGAYQILGAMTINDSIYVSIATATWTGTNSQPILLLQGMSNKGFISMSFLANISKAYYTVGSSTSVEITNITPNVIFF